MGTICAKWWEAVCSTFTLVKSAERRAPSAERRAPSAERRAPSAERRAPSAEAMTAPRARERRRPPSPPDRRPPRRGGGSSSHTYAVSANGSARPSGHGAFRRAAAALLVLLAATAALAPAGRAQEATALQATMTVGLFSLEGSTTGFLIQQLGYNPPNSIGNLSPMQFNYPASSAEAAAYTVIAIYVTQEGNPNVGGVHPNRFQFAVRGAATTGTTAVGRGRLRLRRVRRTRRDDALGGSRARRGRRPDVARGRALVARAAPRHEPRRHAQRGGQRRRPRARGAVPVHAALVGGPVRRRSGFGPGFRWWHGGRRRSLSMVACST